ncbi:MAG: hypothetical protein FWE31_01225 [Firmicutes bacterium]|nr:hypothetical protein [Bacillota bacterium]
MKKRKRNGLKMLGLGAVAIASAGLLAACTTVAAGTGPDRELEEVRYELASVQASLAAAEASLLEATNNLNTAQANLATTQADLVATITLRDTAQANVVRLEGELATAEGQRDTIQTQLLLEQAEVSRLSGRAIVLQGEINTLNSQIAVLNGYVLHYQNQRNHYRAALANMEGQRDSYRAVMGVLNLIGALPNNITIADYTAVREAQQAFNSLTTAQQGMVTAAFVTRLDNAVDAISNAQALTVADFNADGRGIITAIENGVSITGNAWTDGAIWSVSKGLKSMIFNLASTLENNQFATFIISFNNIVGAHAGENRFGVAKYDGNLYFGQVGGVDWASPEAAIAGQLVQIRNGMQIASEGQFVISFDFDANAMSAVTEGEVINWIIPAAAQNIRALWVITNTTIDLTSMRFVASERNDLGASDFSVAGRGDATVTDIEGGVQLTFNHNADGPIWRADKALEAFAFDMEADIQNGEFVVVMFSYSNHQGNHTGINEARLGIARDNSGQLFTRFIGGVNWGSLNTTFDEILGGQAINSLGRVIFTFNFDAREATARIGGTTLISTIPSNASEVRALWVAGTANSIDMTSITVIEGAPVVFTSPIASVRARMQHGDRPLIAQFTLDRSFTFGQEANEQASAAHIAGLQALIEGNATTTMLSNDIVIFAQTGDGVVTQVRNRYWGGFFAVANADDRSIVTAAPSASSTGRILAPTIPGQAFDIAKNLTGVIGASTDWEVVMMVIYNGQVFRYTVAGTGNNAVWFVV